MGIKICIIIEFLNSLVSTKTPIPPPQQKLRNIINLFGDKFPMLNKILPDAKLARDGILEWKKELMATWTNAADVTSELAYVKGETDSIELVRDKEFIPDFDILLIVGGPLDECNERLYTMMNYLSYVETKHKIKDRHIIISGRGGWSLPSKSKNWMVGEVKEEAKTEAEYILKKFLTMFTENTFTPEFFNSCKISVDTAALDTVGNAVMAKYLSLQANIINGNEEKTFAGKTIVSVSNLYHIGRLVYLMKNFMPKATHYGVIQGGGGTDNEMTKVNENPDSSTSIKQAYDQSFTRDVGYIVPTFSNKCVKGHAEIPLDLGLFEFLMHHGLYHNPQIAADQIKNPGNPGKQIWNSEMTSKEVIQYIGNFCLPFTSLEPNWDINSVINTKIFRENCNMANEIMGDKYDKLYTFSDIECKEELSLPPLPSHPSPVAPSHWKDKITNPMRHHLGGNKQKRKKRTRRRKMKKKKNRSRKK